MKRILVLIATCLLSLTAAAQSASVAQKIADGRAALAAHDLAGAKALFAEALGAEPTNQTAAALLGITRWFALSVDPSATAYLDGLNISKTRRSVYAWSPEFPRSADGKLSLPSAYDLSDTITFWRDFAVPEAQAAGANFAVVTTDDFLLSVSASETGRGALNIDRGDILMCRALLRSFEGVVHLLRGQNLHGNLAGMSDLLQGDMSAFQRVLTENPNLLKAASDTERSAARAALLDAVDLYRAASEFIRGRTGSVDRLFMLESEDLAGEAQFRASLDGIVQSMTDWAPLPGSGRFAKTSPLFSADWSLRDSLPSFTLESFKLFSPNQATFGGTLTGFTREELAARLAGFLGLSPDLGMSSVTPTPAGNSLNRFLLVNGKHILVGGAGVVASSSDGLIWSRTQLPGVGALRGLNQAAGAAAQCGDRACGTDDMGDVGERATSVGSRQGCVAYAQCIDTEDGDGLPAA